MFRPLHQWMALTFCLFTAVAVGVASASETSSAPPAVVLPAAGYAQGEKAPNGAEVTEALETALHEELAREKELDGPGFVQEREVSRFAYSDMDSPAEITFLLRSRFGDLLATLNQDPARFLSDATLKQVGGETTGRVSSDGSEALLEAGIPLRTKDEEGRLRKVDLSLAREGSDFVSENPLVEAEISEAPSDGTSLSTSAGEVVIRPAVDHESEAGFLGDQNLLYPNVNRDHDLLVSPIANGIEFSDLLRSAESPERLRYNLELPPDARIVSDGAGGATIVKEGATVAHVPSPAAVDAQGSEVPVTLEIDGAAIVLRVDHQATSFAYPILVDPIYELTEGWYWYGGSGISALSDGTWQWGSNVGWIYGSTSCIYACWGSGRGLFVSTPSGAFNGNQFGQWTYTPPGSTSYVTGASLNPFWRDNHNCSKTQYPQPHDYAGLWNPSGWTLFLADEANNKGSAQFSGAGRVLVVGLGTGPGGSNPCWRDLMLGGASVWITDPDNPTWNGAPGISSVWTDTTMLPISVSASDAGLGVKSFNLFTTDGAGNPVSLIGSASQPCSGLKASACPSSWSTQITNYSPTTLPNGVRALALRAYDPLPDTHYAGQGVYLKVDHAAPIIKTSGELLSPKPIKYHLDVEAEDGSSAALDSAQSGMKKLEFYVDGKYEGAWPSENPPNCTNPQQGIDVGSCKFVGINLDLPRILSGKHSVKIVAIDSLGHSTTKVHELELPKDETLPQLAASGPLKAAPGGWVSQGETSVTLEAKDIETGIVRATLFIDGEEVTQPVLQECKFGGCSLTSSKPISLTGYEEGPHSVKAVAYDAAGNSAQLSWTVKVDPSRPTLKLTTTPEVPSGWTPQLASLSVGFTATDSTATTNGSGIAKVEALLPQTGGTTYTQTLYSSTCTTCPQQATGTKALEKFSTLAQGTIQVPVKAYDLAGNVTTQTLTLNVDRDAPAVIAFGSFSEAASGTLVGNSKPLFLFITDKGSGITGLELLLNGKVEETMTLEEIEAGGGVQTCSGETCSFGYSFIPDIGQNLSSGKYTFVVRATDRAGRIGSFTREVTLDARAPTLKLTTTPEVPSGWTPQLASLSVGFTATDSTATTNGSGIAKVEALLPQTGGTTYTQTLYSSTCTTCPQQATGTKALEKFSTLAQGTIQVPVKAYDLAGNVTTQTLTLNVDRNAPEVKAAGLLAEAAAGTLIGASKLDLTITDKGSGITGLELLLNGKVEETMTLEEIEADEGTQTCSGETCSFGYSFIPDIGQNLSSGKYTFVVRATDRAGRIGSFTREVTLDAESPELSFSGSLTEFAGKELTLNEAGLKAIATDPGSVFTSGIKRIVVAVDGAQVAALNECKSFPCAVSRTLSYNYKESEWGVGPHEIEVLANDWVGNTIKRSLMVNAPITAIAPKCPSGPQETVQAVNVVTPTEALQSIASAVPPAVAPTAPSENEPPVESPFDPSVAKEAQTSINQQGIDVIGTPTGGGLEDAPAGDFTVGQALCMQPVQKTSASNVPVEVGGDAVLYANSAPATDTVVRPTAFGTTIIEHRRGPAAPSSFSWEVKLGPGEELQKLANGSVVVVKSGVNVNKVEVPSSVPDLDPGAIPDVETQLLRQGANLAEANNAVEAEVTAVIAPPVAVLGTGTTAPALLQISGGTIVTATLPPNVVADTIAVIIEANTSPDPVAMCAHVFAPTPDLYADGCGEEGTIEDEPPASPDEWEELTHSSWEPVVGSGGAEVLINSPSNPIDNDKAWCFSRPDYPIYCAYFKEDKRKAEERTAKLFNIVSDGTKSNEFQHSYWVALMVNSKPPDSKAFEFAMNHEKSQENSASRNERYNSRMDKLNNRVGYKYATNNEQSDRGACEAMVSKIGPSIYVGRQRNPAAWANRNGWQAYSLIYRIKYVEGDRIKLISQDCS